MRITYGNHFCTAVDKIRFAGREKRRPIIFLLFAYIMITIQTLSGDIRLRDCNITDLSGGYFLNSTPFSIQIDSSCLHLIGGKSD